jgi:hypothetical protein
VREDASEEEAKASLDTSWIAKDQPISAAKLKQVLEDADKRLAAVEAKIAVLEASAGPPVGMILAFAQDKCPEGYLDADGKSIGKNEYGVLCELLGSTWGQADATQCRLPSLQNRFLRGAGVAGDGKGGTTVAVGAFQDDAIKAHSHAYSGHVYYPQGGGPTATLDPGGVPDGYMQTEETGIDETRPKSYGVRWCIKY